MRKKVGLIGFVVIVFAIALIGTGEVEATNCYDLYYSGSFLDTYWESWPSIKVALHRDMNWEHAGLQGTYLSGTWNVFGNAIFLQVTFAWSEKAPDLFSGLPQPLLAGVKSGSAKLIPGDPLKSKASISKAQGFFQYNSIYIGSWYLKKVKIDQCEWISE